jgi:plasmid stabilization system protein ParE
MKYGVIMMPRAENDLTGIFRYIHDRTPRAADEWLKRAMKSMETLAHHPERCPLAPESAAFEGPVRQLFLRRGQSRDLSFSLVVLDDSVYVLHVRHGSMLPLIPDE